LTYNIEKNRKRATG